MNTVLINGNINSVFVNSAQLVTLKIYKSDKDKSRKILAVTVRYGQDIRTDACFETFEIPVKSIYDNVDIITRLMIGVNKIPPNTRDAIDVDDILGDMVDR
jgi:hypothetical protein